MVWPEEVKEWTNFYRFKVSMIHGPKREQGFNEKADIYITTPDSIEFILEKLKGVRKKNWPFDFLIVDESGKFKNFSSKRYKLIKKLVKGFKYRYIANGTPVGNGYLGLMPQMFIVDYGQSLGAKISYYRAKYFDQIGNPQWASFELQKSGDKRIMKRIKKFVICLKAEDHVSMPKIIEKRVFISLPLNALRAYRELEEEMFTEIRGSQIVAEATVALGMKLHQICNGAVYKTRDPLEIIEERKPNEYLLLHNEKSKELENVIEEFSGKSILIAYRFKTDKVLLKKYFRKKITFFDEVKDKVKLQKKWNKNKIPLLAANTMQLSHGLNLQKGGAQVIVFFSIDFDFEVHDQFIRRLRRSGNKSDKIFVVKLLMKNGFDHLVINPRLKKKKKVHLTFFERLIRYRNTMLRG